MVSEVNVNEAAAGRARGAVFARTAEALLDEAGLDTIDPAHAVQLATANALLALYWELRQQHQAAETLRRPCRSEPGS
jgi:hypothetical protein